MKLIKSAFLVTSLLTLNASAQPGPPPLPPPVTASSAPTNSAPQPAPRPPQHPNGPSPAAPNTRLMPNMPPGAKPGAPKVPPVMPDKEKLSYAIGFDTASRIKRFNLDVDIDTFVAAMKDISSGKTPRYDEKQVKEILTQVNAVLRARMAEEKEKEMAEAKAKGEEAKVKGEEYLAKNAKDPAVKTLPNGIQYKVLTEGAGAMPKPTDSVTVSYKGRLTDGTIFDQNDHFSTPLKGRVIKGWSEVLPMMKTGAKWEVVIPSDLAYGPSGHPPKIVGNSVLIFEMELISITPGPPPSATPPAAVGPHPGQQGAPAPANSTPVVSGQIIKVPSKAELDKGAKIEVITNVPNSQ